MKTIHRRQYLLPAILGVALGSLTGCQTWVPAAGLTLPSGHYLQHRPQYFAPSPDFPLQRELASMEAQAAAANVAGAPAPLPPPGPVAPGPAPAQPGL